MGETADQLRADIEYRRDRMSGTVDAIEDRVVPGRIIRRRTEAARGVVGRARARVMGTPHQLADQVGSASDTATAGAQKLVGNMTGLPGQVSEQTRGAPLLAGGVAFGVGAMVAMLLPETQPEQRLAQTLEPGIATLTDAAKESAQEAVSSTRDAAQHAVAEIKDTASEHATQAGDQARDAVEQVATTAKDAASTGPTS
jgi:hypothetical protein